MAITVATPKNLRQVKPRFIGNFTKRQVFSIGAAAMVGFPLYYATRGALGNDIAAIVMVFSMMPCLLFVTENLKYGLPAEKLLLLVWRHKNTQGIRPYKAENLFVELEERERIKKEVQDLEEKARNGKKNQSNGSDKGNKKRK